MSGIRLLAVALVCLAIALVSPHFHPLYAATVNYYVDSVAGSDANSGTATGSAWKTLAKINNQHFQPGDTIHFRRGSFWTGELVIRDSGTLASPITFADYGSGTRPTISNPGTGTRPTISNPGTGTRGIKIFGSWVQLQGFLVEDTGDVAVEIESGASHNVVWNVEVANAGQGISVTGEYNLITNNYAHDLHMIVNTPGGDDDYGALGFLIMNSDNEVAYNSCINCRAPSYDYGYDGGVVEIYSNGDNSFIHNNYGRARDGFIEVGVGTARNVRLAYNISDNNYTHFACLHTGGTFGSSISNLRIENNTIINTTAAGWGVINCAHVPLTSSQLYFRNNVVYANMIVATQGGFTHANNTYLLLAGSQVGFALAGSERIVDPQFANLDGGDYQLQASSPAINSGLGLGYIQDYANQPVPQGGVPDIGAYEFVMRPADLPVHIFIPVIAR